VSVKIVNNPTATVATTSGHNELFTSPPSSPPAAAVPMASTPTPTTPAIASSPSIATTPTTPTPYQYQNYRPQHSHQQSHRTSGSTYIAISPAPIPPTSPPLLHDNNALSPQ
jgi:hypothetical protein